jgi:hypothetical protein
MRTFLFVKPTPEQLARMSAEERVRLAEQLERQEARERFGFEYVFLVLGSIVYGLIGYAVFRQRRRSAGSVAVAIVLLTFLAGLEINIG